LAKLDVTVTYDARHGYIATALELRQPVVALSLGGLRRRIEALMVPGAAIAQLDQRTALPDQCLHSAEADVRPQGGSPGLTPSPTLPRGLTGLVKLKNKKTRSRLHKNSVKNSASHRIAVPILQFNHIFVRTRDFSGPSARAQTVGSSQHKV